MAINSIHAYINEQNSKTNSSYDPVRNEHHLCSSERQTSIVAHMQAIVLLRYKGAGIIMVETHRHILKGQCFVTAQSLMKILLLMPFYVYISDVSAKLVSLTNFLIDSIASNAPTYSWCTRDNETPRLLMVQEDMMRNDTNETNIRLRPFTISYQSAMISKVTHAGRRRIWMKIRIGIGEKSWRYCRRILQIAKNWFPCSQSLIACGMATLLWSYRRSTE